MNRLSSEAHVVEEINGVRCSIVEKNVSPERVEFLEKLLQHNGYTVMTAPTPPPPVKKPIVSPQAPPSEGDSVTSSAIVGDLEGVIPAPSTSIVGVTHIAFHPMLAVYERSLLTPDGKTVSIAYWNQESEKEGEVYWQRRVE
ncbi:MAG: hypothetical protein HY840_02540 [Bacteroidetes bacterium]|nr:hypothetical protein [Bacteroidota bacterium]